MLSSMVVQVTKQLYAVEDKVGCWIIRWVGTSANADDLGSRVGRTDQDLRMGIGEGHRLS